MNITTTSTKAIAHKAGVKTAVVNSVARDLGLAMSYNHTNHYWMIIRPADAQLLVSYLSESI